MNSVRPWTAPRTIAWRADMGRQHRRRSPDDRFAPFACLLRTNRPIGLEGIASEATNPPDTTPETRAEPHFRRKR